MDIKKLQTIVVDALEDVKAQDIKVFDTVHLTSLFDRVCIASGTSNRQTRALASSVREMVKQHGGDVISVEGEDVGEWVLVDLGDMVVHIMQPVIRGYYRLEELWGDKEVKVGAAKRISKRTASEPEDAPAVRSTLNQASQTTVDDEPGKAAAKPARKPRAKAADSESAPRKATSKAGKASAATSADTPTKATKPASPRKKAIGTTVKVPATKTAVASAKAAATKRATTRRKTSA